MTTTTGIRIEVPYDLYEKLQEVQNKIRTSTGKKPALSAIILKFCSEKLSASEYVQKDVHVVRENVQKPEHTGSDLEKASPGAEKRLLQWDERLSRWEKSLLEREKRIKEQEREIYQEKAIILDSKSKLLDEREKAHKQTLEGTEKLFELKILQNELNHKDDKIQQLTRELGSLKETVQTAKRDHKQAEPKTFLEKIKEYMPWIITVLVIIAAYLLAKKGSKPALPEELKGLAPFFDGLSEEDQKALGEKLKYYANLYSVPAKEENSNQSGINKSPDK
jgi:chromosome segregation ATPase